MCTLTNKSKSLECLSNLVFNQLLYHIGTSQLIYNINELGGFYMMRILVLAGWI